MNTELDWVDKLPAVLHRWHELTSSEQEAIARVVNRMASLPLRDGEWQRCTEWRNTYTAGIEVHSWDRS